MPYLNFHKEDLINLEFSLEREILRTNRSGAYASHSIIGCNTRKYHGLLVCPIEHFNGQKHVLLSALDLSVIYDNSEFNLGIRRYPGDVFQPAGHKYIQSFKAEEVPSLIYRIGGVRIKREALLSENEQQILISYTVIEADKPISLKFSPFLAFRDVHDLSKANMFVNSKVKQVEHGISTCLYDEYPDLYLQLSKKPEYVHVPDWYYNIEYPIEQRRGYDFHEDLFVPGYFEVEASQGETILFSAGTEESSPHTLLDKFNAGTQYKTPRNTFKNCLINSAQQFFVSDHSAIDIKAGYHWMESRVRDTFIALPGLTIAYDDTEAFFQVIDSKVAQSKQGFFPTEQKADEVITEPADASLWFIWCLQQHYQQYGDGRKIWRSYGKYIKKILNSYSTGINNNIHMHKNGLIHTGDIGFAVTWMNAVFQGRPITPRTGYCVEINALWYNAIVFSLELAGNVKDSAFKRKWKKLPEKIAASFQQVFWNDEKAYLADNSNMGKTDWSIRPNQTIAASMIHSPLTLEQKNSILETTRQFLLTPRGLRSLAPTNQLYKGIYSGSQEQRDHAYHQGSVWPWLMQHYCEAHLQVHKKSGIAHVKKLLNEFESTITEHGISSISEIYDGNPPHAPKGVISYSCSVAALLKIMQTVESFETH